MNDPWKRNDVLDLAARLWICLLLIIVLASLGLYLWGFSLWTAILFALALVCPAIILWGIFTLRSNDGAGKQRTPQR